MDKSKYLPIISGIIFSSVFGFSFLFTKNALDVVNPFHLLGFRFGLAALFFTILYFLNMFKLNYKNKNLKLLFVLAFMQPVIYFVCETMGINLTTSAEAGLMISLIPVFVVILSSIFLKEKPTKLQLISVILSVIGVVFIIIMRESLEVQGNYWGLVFLFGAVIAGAGFSTLSRKLSLDFTPQEITFIMMWFGAIIFNIIGLIEYNGDYMHYFMELANTEVLISVIYLGIFSSVIAFFMLNYTLSRIDSFKAAVFANLSTIIAIFAGIVFRGEPFYWFQIVGSIMIITGVFGTNYFDTKKKFDAKKKKVNK